jgi:hypothetical protein
MAGTPWLHKTVPSLPAFFGTAFLIVQVACAPLPEGPMASRVLPVEKRHAYLQSHGSDAPLEIRNAFMDGMVAQGMAREWVLELYGRPDRITDRGWEYLDRKGNTILGMSFEQDKVDSITAAPGPP